MKPITGRRHQLRVHLSHINHTIVGDYTYSDRKDIEPYRMYLHAYKLYIPSKLENLNAITDDPFSEDIIENKWHPKERVNDLNSNTIEKLNNFSEKYKRLFDFK